VSEQTNTVSLLIEAKEFVAYISHKERSDECWATNDVYISPAKRLRLRAEEIEQYDAMIMRARALLAKIEPALNNLAAQPGKDAE
jgi:hypothetical protein